MSSNKRIASPAPASASAPAPESKGQSYKSLGVLLTILVFAAILFMWLKPLWCGTCYYVDSIQMSAAFQKFGFQSDYLKQQLAYADASVAPDALDLSFDFDESGRNRSVGYQGRHLDPDFKDIGTIRFKLNPNEKVSHILYFSGIDYKIPVVDISVSDVIQIIQYYMGIRRNTIDIYLDCESNCSIIDVSARLVFNKDSGNSMEITGSDMKLYFDHGEETAFLPIMIPSRTQPIPLDLVRFIAFKAKSVLDSCAYDVIQRSHFPTTEALDHKSEPVILFSSMPIPQDYCTLSMLSMRYFEGGDFSDVAGYIFEFGAMMHGENRLQFDMLDEFARWKTDPKYDGEGATWLNERICEENSELMDVGTLHRFLLVKLGLAKQWPLYECPKKKEK
ncbi:hypothetical protein [Mesorhizobium shangrilense]|uniref:Uncharacterized protein n=1 Tax=Mesorhizobium shangrilense TaxID=460060 RepID=A0ABV2DS17_9HYPH